MIKVLLADDHAILRSGLKEIMGMVPEVKLVGEAANGAEVLETLRNGLPDLLMMDMSMPGISGIELISRIVGHYPSLPILVLSMINEVQVVQRALKAGARGYITKDRPPEELIIALRKVASGGKYIERDLAEQMLFNQTEPDRPHDVLTSREMEIFELLVRGKSVNEIADDLCISNKTVSTHKVHVLEKLNMKNTAELVRYAVQQELFD